MKVVFNQLKSYYDKYEQEILGVLKEVLASGWYILGHKVETFEKQFASWSNSQYCVGLNSGLDALILAVRALGITKGDEVIVQGNTYIASVLGITENGATPVFVDPGDDYNLDLTQIEASINKRTKAIMVVHLYGQATKMEGIIALAQKYNLFVIEDCAQSHGATYQGKMTGTFGDIGCFSFYPTKNFGAFGDAGAIITDNEAIYSKIKMLRNYGSREKYQNDIQGINSRLDEIQAALLSFKLQHIHDINEERIILANRYLERITNPIISLPMIHEANAHVFHLFVIRCEHRDQLSAYLKEHNIETQIHYPIPPHLSKAYCKEDFSKVNLPITEQYASQVLSLPIYYGMTLEEVDYVSETINRFNVGEK